MVKIGQALTSPMQYINCFTINSLGYIYAGARNGVSRSTDNGESWEIINNEMGNTAIWALSINSYGDIFAGGSYSGIYRSTNNGDNWIQLLNAYITSLAINSKDDIFAGSYDQGIFSSTDNGENWIQINDGLTSSSVLSLTVNNIGYVFAATDSGVFRSIHSTTPIIVNDNTSNIDFRLYQNYPNPFNPSTQINFYIPEPGLVSVKIYDILGSEVKTLINEYRNTGRYEVTWRGDNNVGKKISSGIYFYTLTSGDFVQTKKMLLIQ